MGYEDDRIFLLQLLQSRFDLAGGDGIQARCRFVEQDNFGLQSQDACQADALLLSPGEGDGRRIQAVLDFLPDGCQLQASLDCLVQLGAAFFPGQFQAVGEILANAHRQNNRTGKDHAHLAPQGNHIQLGIENVHAIDQDLTGGGLDLCEIIQPVQAAQQC